MNRDIAEQIYSSCIEKLRPLCEEYGIQFEFNSIDWNILRLEFEITIYDSMHDDKGNLQTIESYRFRENYLRLEMSNGWLFRKFWDRPKKKGYRLHLQVIGLISNVNSKRPILVKELDTGKLWKYSVKRVRDKIGQRDKKQCK